MELGLVCMEEDDDTQRKNTAGVVLRHIFERIKRGERKDEHRSLNIFCSEKFAVDVLPSQ